MATKKRTAAEMQAAEEEAAGAKATPEDFQASQEAARAAAVPSAPDLSVCVNDGSPAMWRTTSAGRVAVSYCDNCARAVYPGQIHAMLESVSQGGGDGVTEEAPATGKFKLRDGSTVDDPRLDRLVEFDERSRQFPMRTLLAELEPKNYKPRSYTWKCDLHINQGNEGSCVGHAWAHELAAKPVVIEGIDSPMARWIYKTAQKYDPWAGEAYEGTSTLAGAKVVQSRPPKMSEGRGLFDEYRWIFGDLDELIKTLGYFGPVVAGLDWHAGMMKTDANGFIRRTGAVLGGHCVLFKGVSLAKAAVRVHNSWGTNWGEGGDAWLSFSDLEQLLDADGELCVPVHRREWG